MGKKLGECFGDDAPSRAFRFVSKCGNLEEQLKLFEETVGTALFELQEEVPRRVERCDKTLKEIKAREAALRKRANRFKLTELPEAEWPEEQKYRQRLLAFCGRIGKSTMRLRCFTRRTSRGILFRTLTGCLRIRISRTGTRAIQICCF